MRVLDDLSLSTFTAGFVAVLVGFTSSVAIVFQAALAFGAGAGLALLGTIGNALAMALQEQPHREAATITFLVTLSGVAVAGIGSAFWGVVAGGVAIAVQQYARRSP